MQMESTEKHCTDIGNPIISPSVLRQNLFKNFHRVSQF